MNTPLVVTKELCYTEDTGPYKKWISIIFSIHSIWVILK